MARFSFLTFYDKICLGPRILSAVVKEQGHEADLVIFKADEGGVLLPPGRRKAGINYQFYHHGFLRGSNFDINPWTEKELSLLVDLLAGQRPDLVCLSTRSFWTAMGRRIVDPIRQALPGTPVIAGGWGPSLEPEKYLDYCDFVCFGEGERTIADAGEALDRGEDLTDLPNIIHRDGDGRLVRNEAHAPLENLDALPFPDFAVEGKYLIDEDRVRTGREFTNRKIYDVFAGRGCPMTCTYCMSGRWDQLYSDRYGYKMPKIRFRRPESVIEEIVAAAGRGAEFIRVKDEVFPARRSWVDRFTTLYREQVGLPFFAYLRPEFHPPGMVRSLCRAGLTTTGLGIQSGSDRIRRDVYLRKCTNDKVLAFARVLRDEGVKYHYDLISFNPFERREEMRDTFDFLCRLPRAEINVFKLAYFPGAPISGKVEELAAPAEPDRIHHWYSILYCLVMGGPATRAAARLIERSGLFRRLPGILQLLALPSLVREFRHKRRARKRFNVTSVTLPEKV